MKKGNKKWIVFIGILVVVILVGLMVVSGLKKWSNRLVYQKNWNVDIPKELKLQYHKDTGASFHGDGITYDIYKCMDAEFDVIREMDELEWGDEEAAPKYQDSFPEFMEECLKILEIPGEEYPNYENCIFAYMCQEDNSEIVFAYDSEVNKLYIASNMI